MSELCPQRAGMLAMDGCVSCSLSPDVGGWMVFAAESQKVIAAEPGGGVCAGSSCSLSWIYTGCHMQLKCVSAEVQWGLQKRRALAAAATGRALASISVGGLCFSRTSSMTWICYSSFIFAWNLNKGWGSSVPRVRAAGPGISMQSPCRLSQLSRQCKVTAKLSQPRQQEPSTAFGWLLQEKPPEIRAHSLRAIGSAGHGELSCAEASPQGNATQVVPGEHLQRAEVVSPSSWWSTSAKGRGHLTEFCLSYSTVCSISVTNSHTENAQ